MTSNHDRAVKYRKLALAEKDRSTAELLIKLADEADRDVLCTAEWSKSIYQSANPAISK